MHPRAARRRLEVDGAPDAAGANPHPESGKSRGTFFGLSPATVQLCASTCSATIGYRRAPRAQTVDDTTFETPAGARRTNRGTPHHSDSAALGAPGNGAAGVSLWIFAALLVPFFLTAPWWARRHRSATFRRLLSVVLRLERPG